ncbi:ORFL38C [Human betaherpesvirus 5]|nr:ORFL38C [Human betaherpesvirus 5]QHX40330.1 ORFL38C [Human betaherpesvirus 5]
MIYLPRYGLETVMLKQCLLFPTLTNHVLHRPRGFASVAKPIEANPNQRAPSRRRTAASRRPSCRR